MKKAFAPNVALGGDFQHASGGILDCVLVTTDNRSVAMVEAKKAGVELFDFFENC
jgi:hypothetical protein